MAFDYSEAYEAEANTREITKITEKASHMA